MVYSPRWPALGFGSCRDARSVDRPFQNRRNSSSPVHSTVLLYSLFRPDTAVSPVYGYHGSGSPNHRLPALVSRDTRARGRAPRPAARRAPRGSRKSTSSVRRRSAASPRAGKLRRALPNSPSAPRETRSLRACARRRPSADARRAAREARPHMRATVAPLAR